jgi:DNA-binding MarR family transcriptional regulator
MFDPLLHHPVRTKIISMLSSSEKLSYKTLKEETGLTDGNLAGYLRSLEDASYIEFEKIFEGRRPKTVYMLTDKGRTAFLDYLEALKEFIKEQS